MPAHRSRRPAVPNTSKFDLPSHSRFIAVNGALNVRVWRDWRCLHCGTNRTYERRSGPGGKAELCNPCGIKHANAVRAALKIRADEEQKIRSLMNVYFVVNAEDVHVGS